MSDRAKPYPQKARERIRAGKIITKLQQHVDGEVEMSSTQLQAARILLAKALPDLQSVEHTGSVDSKPLREMSENELNERIARLTAAAAGEEEADTGAEVGGSVH